MDEWIKVAELGKPFALKGEVKARSLTSFPELRFTKGRKLLARQEEAKEGGKELTLRSYRASGNALTFLFEEIRTPEEAESLRGLSLYIRKEEAPVPEGYYRLEDLKGLIVKNDLGYILGKIDDVLTYSKVPSIKAVREGGKPFYFPFLMDDFISKIDLEKKEMIIHEVPGML